MELLFLADKRYLDLDSVGAEVVRVLGVTFEERDSDYLGGRYLISKARDGTVVEVMKNFSAFLGEQQVECPPSAGVYIIVVTGRFEPSRFLQLGTLPGIVLHRTRELAPPARGR